VACDPHALADLREAVACDPHALFLVQLLSIEPVEALELLVERRGNGKERNDAVGRTASHRRDAVEPRARSLRDFSRAAGLEGHAEATEEHEHLPRQTPVQPDRFQRDRNNLAI
jgi:hypothetical protein